MKINKLTNDLLPVGLRRLSDPPEALYTSCEPSQLDSLLARPGVAIIGSRKLSAYGRQVTADLAAKLAALGVVVISGLALGVDAVAHQAALDAGGLTLAVLPGPLEKIYPASHAGLARAIIARGGALLSEYPAGTAVQRWNFVARNRLIAGLADVVVITEAAVRSGSLHTAGFGLDQGKPVLAVPGNITSQTSVGTNNLIKAGAIPATSHRDVLQALGMAEPAAPARLIREHPGEQRIVDLLQQGIRDGDTLQARSHLSPAEFNQSLTMLELSAAIRSLGANSWVLV